MRTAVIDGCRTPFVRSGTHFARLTAIDLGRHAVTELLARTQLPPDVVDHLVYGTVVHDPQAPNIAREVGLAALPKDVPSCAIPRGSVVMNELTGSSGRFPAVRFPPSGFQPCGLRRLRIACLSWASSGCW